MKQRIFIGESGYLTLISEIFENGVDVFNDRTGHFCKTIHDAKFIIPEGEHFLVTHRSVPMRLAFEEFWFFLNGRTDTKELEAKGCNFWKGNTTRDFLDNRGLSHLPEGNLGHAYSCQWRNSGGDLDDDFAINWHGFDQLANLYKGLRDDKYGRRHLVTLWNPDHSCFMPLTPCWHTSQYTVLPNKDGKDYLHVKLINRSLDVPFGMLFAVQQYRLFQIALCKLLGFELGELVADITSAHIYDNQIEYAKEIEHRDYDLNPNHIISITKELKTLSDVLQMEWSDVKIENHFVNKRPFRTQRPAMAT